MFAFAMMETPFVSPQNPDALLPIKYQEFEDVFNTGKASTLPDHYPYDCPLNLQLGKEPSWGPIYNLSR